MMHMNRIKDIIQHGNLLNCRIEQVILLVSVTQVTVLKQRVCDASQTLTPVAKIFLNVYANLL